VKVGRVIGNLVASAHHPDYDGHKLMLVRPEKPDGSAAGSAFLAVDTVQAGPGDLVLVMSEGNGVRQILGAKTGPIRSLIVGIIDDLNAPGVDAHSR